MPTPQHIVDSLSCKDDPDALLLMQLATTGADLRKPHLPEFAFEATTRVAAEAIATELADQGFDVEVQLPQADDDNPNHWVIAKRLMVLDWTAVYALSERFEALAAQHNASYDGWGAEIVE